MSWNAPPGQPFRARLAAIFAGELVNKGCVTVAFMWLARTLVPSLYGEVEWALSLTMVATLAADAGLSTWAAARIAATPERAPALVARVGWLRLALALPAYVTLLAIARTYGGTAGAALAIYGLVLFLTPFFLQYLFNGLLQSRWSALAQAVRGATFATAVFLFVSRTSSPSAVAFAEVLGAAALALCSLIVFRSVFRLPVLVAEGPTRLLSLFTESWPIGASDVTWSVHWYAGLILLGYLATTTDAAWYSAALRLVMALHTIVWLYLLVLLPNLSRLVGDDSAGWARIVEQSLRLTGWAGYIIALTGTLAAGTILTALFGLPFRAAVPALRAMIWIVPIAWMSGHIRYSLVAAQHPKKDYQAALVGAGTTIMLTIALAPALRSVGAGVAVLSGSIANAVAAGLFAKRRLPRFAFRRSMAPSSIGCLGCLILGAILTPVAGEVVSTLVAVAVLAALAIYAERESAKELLHALAGDFKLRWARTDVNT